MNKLTTSIPTKARDIIQNALQNKRYKLLEPESKELIAAFGITTARHTVTASVKEAIQAATSIGYPIVLKIVSPDISHKTDVGGVKVGIKDDEGVKAAYEEIMKNVNIKKPDARIEGILVEEMATPSTEVIVGGLRDPQFGPAVMFGLGGIFVEIYKDVSFRIAPLEEYEALDMIHEIKGSKILKGFRNTEALDITSLAQTIIKVSNIMVSIEEIKEIDLNPVLVYPKGVKAVDARIILSRL
ncbi:MAG: acetate--CoA ligase family protein [Candidatus Brocadiaceae bacterium]|nr:acetate--CoA ligase family protein [Candidatus Brocadiaceae bacterium]